MRRKSTFGYEEDISISSSSSESLSSVDEEEIKKVGLRHLELYEDAMKREFKKKFVYSSLVDKECTF